MLKNLTGPLFAVLMLVSAVAVGQTELFKQTDLSQWDFHVDAKDVAVTDVFSFNADGVLVCKGKPFGYLATKEAYGNFVLTVEYRWPQDSEPTNSGIFLRIANQPENTFLPRCMEVQLQHKNAGDLWGFHGMTVPAPKGMESRFSARDGGEKLGQMSGGKKLQDAELPPGQWNKLNVFCSGGMIVVTLNDKLVNWVTAAPRRPGKIGFQSEGGPVEFRAATLEVIEMPERQVGREGGRSGQENRPRTNRGRSFPNE